MTKVDELRTHLNTLPEGAEVDIRGLSERFKISRGNVSSEKTKIRPDLKAKFNLPKTKKPQPITDLILKAYNELGKGKDTLTLDIWEKIQNDPLVVDKTQTEGLSTIGKRLVKNKKPYKINPGGAGKSMRKKLLQQRREYLEAAKDVTKPTIVYKDGKAMNVAFPKAGPLSEANFVKTLKKYYETPHDISGKLSKQRNKIIKDFKITPGTTAFQKIQKFIADKHNISSDRPYKYGTQYGSQQQGTEERVSKTKTQSTKTFEGMVGLKKRKVMKELELLKSKQWKWGYEPLDLAHRLSLGASKKWGLQQTTSTIGLDRPVVNQVFVEHFQKKLNKIYSIQKNLIKNKPENWRAKLESTNKMVTSIVNDADNRIVGVTVDEKTLKPRLYGDKFATKWAIDNGWLDTDIKNIKKDSAQYKFIRDHLIEPQVIREAETGLDISKFRNINKEELVKWMNKDKKLKKNTAIKNQTLELLDKYPEITKPQGALGLKTTRGQFERLINGATVNENGICEIFGLARGGLAGGGCGDKMREALQTEPDETLNKVAKQSVKSGEKTTLRTIARQILSKIPKGGKIGALVAGAGAVGLGTAAMMGDAEAEETRITDQTMKYNSTTGTFDNTLTGDPEDQEGILNWIAENPVKGGLLALPAFMGAGYGLSAAGMKRAGAHLMSWKAVIPAMMIPEKMHQWKTGMEAGEMITDPFNAIWALGIDSTASALKKGRYYIDLIKEPKLKAKLLKDFANAGTNAAKIKIGQQAFAKTGADLFGKRFWKNKDQVGRLTKLGRSMVGPAATGTDWSFQKRLKPMVKKLAQAAGSPFAKGAMRQGLGTLAKRAAIGLGAAALLPATVAAGIMSAPGVIGLAALSGIYGQYKDWRDGKAIVDGMRAKGKISEEDAENYMSLIKQGSLPFGLGNRLWGDEEMTIRGQTLNPEQQRALLAGMEDQIDLFQYGDPSRNIEGRQDVRARDRADDFDFFSEGGRVGMKFGGGMDRRAFLKWLAGLGAGAIGAATGLFKSGSKQAIKEIAKQLPKQFANVPGMPAWFPRVVQQIKTHGKLIEMADKHYVNGDIYEMVIPVKVPKFDMVAGQQKQSGFQTVNKKVLLEDNPISGEIEISWKVDDFDGEMTRQINFKPGESGFQKFGVDPEYPGAWEYHRVKVEEPEFTYGNPDQSNPAREEFLYKDIFEEGDEVVKGLEDLTKTKQMVAKDGSIINVADEGKNVDEVFQKKIFKDIEGEAAIIPDPEGHMTPDGWSGDKGNPIIGGDIPTDILKKKARGGTVETGDIARRQSLVPPLSGPDPQGIMGLYSTPKQVRVG